MLPNFSMSGLVAVEHITQHYRDLEIGDVIICMSPAKPGRSVLKRVIGLVNESFLLLLLLLLYREQITDIIYFSLETIYAKILLSKRENILMCPRGMYGLVVII
jgi:hypothetical protein